MLVVGLKDVCVTMVCIFFSDVSGGGGSTYSRRFSSTAKSKRHQRRLMKNNGTATHIDVHPATSYDTTKPPTPNDIDVVPDISSLQWHSQFACAPCPTDHIATNKTTCTTFAMMRYDVVICKVGRPQVNLRINGYMGI